MSVAPKNGKQSDPFNLARNYEGQSGRDSLRIIYSQDGLKWKQLKTNYPKINVRDPSITKIGNYWYVIFTHGLVRTKDFKHWKTLNWQYSKKFKNEWAPEFFKDKTGKYHIILSANTTTNQDFKLYISDFDAKKGIIQNNWKQITGSNLSNNIIDGHIDFKNNQYYLWYKNENNKTIELAKSNNYESNYQKYKTTIPSNTDGVEGPETLWSTNKIRLYFDTYNLPQATFGGIHYTESTNGGKNWSKIKSIKAPFIVRHFEPIKNPLISLK